MTNMVSMLQQAIQLHQQGKLDAAKSLYEQVLQQDKKNSDAHNLLGAVFVAQKQFKTAEKHLLKAVKLAPKYAPASYNLGRCYLDQGLPNKAFGPVQKAVNLDANYLDAIFVLANINVQLGQLKEAEAGYRKVVVMAPKHAEAWNNLGGVLQEQDQNKEAVGCHEKAIDLIPNFQLAYVSLSSALQSLDDNLGSIDVLKKAIELSEHASIYHKLGVNYQQLGQMDDARNAYLKAIDLDPSLGACYRGYAEITKTESAEQVQFIKDAFAIEMTDENLMHLNFAWAKVQDSLKNYDEAFIAYKAGNDLHRKGYSYKSQDSIPQFKALKDTYTEALLSSEYNIDGRGEGVIFVLGMPRSGTTLVEQIISSHSLVTGAGELEYMGNYAKHYQGGANKFHKQFATMSEHQWNDIAESYLQSVAALKDGNPYVTDKMPHNFLNMGMIAKLLPEAKIVHCKRNPVANCLSIYKAYFTAKGSHKYAYNLKELAEYHNLYEDLMDHWRQVMPDKFYEIKYEDLTTNQEEESRKLIEYCGLEWQDACLDFYKTKRKVKTASAFQVRQPMSNKSVGLWKKYGDALQPLIDNLYIPEEYQDQ